MSSQGTAQKAECKVSDEAAGKLKDVFAAKMQAYGAGGPAVYGAKLAIDELKALANERKLRWWADDDAFGKAREIAAANLRETGVEYGSQYYEGAKKAFDVLERLVGREELSAVVKTGEDGGEKLYFALAPFFS